MKVIGLLGGMSWESTASYYRLLNEGVNQQLGALHSAKICLYSVDFQEIETLQRQGEWAKSATLLAAAAQAVEAAGANFILLCTNTMHKVAAEIESAISIPLLHIADATAERLQANGLQTVGLLGTRFTMEQDFFKQRLSEKYGLKVLVPELAERELVHQVIYTELCQGIINPAARAGFVSIIQQLHQAGAEAVILGCTEIGLLVQQADVAVPLFDTTAIHAHAAVVKALT